MRILLFLTILFIMVAQARANNLISAYCPPASELTRTTLINSWAKYRYTGQTAINLPEVGNTLSFTGDSDAEAASNFYAATWTDNTFLCLYSYQDQTIVTYETQLAPFIERCYFSKPGKSSCNATNPQACPITCEISETKRS